MKKLNLGCGNDIRTGWTNLDRVKLPGVDVVHDLNITPLPFPDECFNFILCKDILEHVDLIPLLRELHRILLPGGALSVQVPHFTSKNAYSDPTHVNYFTAQTFKYFSEGHSRSYYFDFSFSAIDVHICFENRLGYVYNRILERLVNSSDKSRNYYEGSPLRVFPATNLKIVLTKASKGAIEKS